MPLRLRCGSPACTQLVMVRGVLSKRSASSSRVSSSCFMGLPAHRGRKGKVQTGHLDHLRFIELARHPRGEGCREDPFVCPLEWTLGPPPYNSLTTPPRSRPCPGGR